MQIRTVGELHDVINAQAKEIIKLKRTIHELTAPAKKTFDECKVTKGAK